MSGAATPMFTPAALAMAERLGLEMGRANIDEFAEALLRLAREDEHIVVVTSDSRGSGKLVAFAQALPRQIVEVGIAEQNLVGVAAGLAACGIRAFGVSPSCFLTARALEQIKNDVCYSDVPAVLVGISAGVSYGALGTTHHSLHDVAVLRAIHNISIFIPADGFETREAVRLAVAATRPIFLRLGKSPMFRLHRPGATFRSGEAIALRPGREVTFIGTGEAVVHAVLAAGLLAERGVSAGVLSMHTLKPLDVRAIVRAGQESRGIITVEEHMVHGGLGEACASALMQASLSVPFAIVGVPDEPTVTGSQADIFRHYGISMEGLAERATQMLRAT